MRFRETDGCACLFCGGRDRVQVVAREDGAAAFAVCAACRGEMAAAWSAGGLPQGGPGEEAHGEDVRRVMAEAAGMTEEAFEEKYLPDIVDRVIFEYVRGYGQAALDGNAMGLLSIMTEQGADVLAAHIEGLAKAGLIYPVAGKPAWYGADYPFADD